MGPPKGFVPMTLQDRSMEISFSHSWIRLNRRLRGLGLRLEQFLRLPRRFLRSCQRRQFSMPALRSRSRSRSLQAVAMAVTMAMAVRNDPGVVPGSGWPWVFRWCW